MSKSVRFLLTEGQIDARLPEWLRAAFEADDMIAKIEGLQATTKLIASIDHSSALLATKDNDFLIRMGISRRFLAAPMYHQQAVGNEVDPSTSYCRAQTEVHDYPFTTAKRPSS